jgi:general L-amino acid transport system permease protein
MIKELYKPGSYPDLAPPKGTVGIYGWLKSNLFSSFSNSLLTLLSFLLLYFLIDGIIGWFLLDAVFDADSKIECRKIDSGACWAVVTRRIDQFIYGFYPEVERWRIDIVFIGLFFASAPLLYPDLPFRRWLLWFSGFYPFIAFILINGGLFGLVSIEINLFGGFMLTMIIGVSGIVCSLPLGIMLALGRQSKLTVVRSISVCFIEFMRGVPLITLLFVASSMLNYFMPPGTNFSILVRVIIMFTFFAAAYIAEVIRGGIQAIPKGQYEAAEALGMTYWQTTRFITLPQAMKISIPGIVNTFIGLYKDTTLVIVIGLLDPLGIGRAAVSDTKWNGLSTETYLFVALFFFVSCFAMSRYSLWLENKLNTDHR